LLLACIGSQVATGRPLPVALQEAEVHVDVVGDRYVAPRKAAQDTIWIADWSFDDGGPCNADGWETLDGRILNDGRVYWDADNAGYDGMGAIVGEAAVLGSHDLCWACPPLPGSVDGYDNDWYQAIRIEYSGRSFLSFDFLLDSEFGFDSLRVEIDPGCASFEQVDLDVDPSKPAVAFRVFEFGEAGLNLSGRVESLELPDFGTSEVHCAYIAFLSDGAFSPADGLQPTTLAAALVVDNIEISGSTTLMEDFENAGTVDPAISFINLWDDQPFGNWARLFQHVTDNDFCSENTTCAWLFTDNTSPTIANDPSMSFGPGAYVVRNWLDNSIVSP
jgi:hypothetical protein